MPPRNRRRRKKNVPAGLVASQGTARITGERSSRITDRERAAIDRPAMLMGRALPSMTRKKTGQASSRITAAERAKARSRHVGLNVPKLTAQEQKARTAARARRKKRGARKPR